NQNGYEEIGLGLETIEEGPETQISLLHEDCTSIISQTANDEKEISGATKLANYIQSLAKPENDLRNAPSISTGRESISTEFGSTNNDIGRRQSSLCVPLLMSPEAPNEEVISVCSMPAALSSNALADLSMSKSEIFEISPTMTEYFS